MPGVDATAVGLADEHAALRRVAELVAGEASPPRVFDAVAHEACRLLGGHFTALVQYEPGEPAVIKAMWGADSVRHVMHVGMRLAEDGDGMVQRVQRYARAQRIDSYEGVPGSNAATARDLGLTSGIGAPIITEGRVWGAITVLGAGPPLPASAEDRLEMFAKLVATAIANTQGRSALAALANEQAALRRVAELVARGAAPREMFAAVAAEASQLLSDEAMTLVRYEGERELVVVASCGGPAPVGERIRFEAETLPERVREDHVVRVDSYTGERDGSLADRYGLAAAVGAPISVAGEVWGMLAATSEAGPLPAGTEDRLQQFAELVAAALANSQARADVQALADEQTALRRIAELTAQEAPAEAVLQAVAVQASRLAGVEFGMVLRFVAPDGSSEIVALNGAPANFKLGLRSPGSGDGSVHRVWRTGRAARVNDLDAMSGRWPRMASRFGFSTSAGVPILLQERELWGALIVAGREPMPPAIESHLADFAELVSTAISATQARSELRELADEQAALRRIAQLTAQEAPADAVLEAVAVQASRLAGVDFTTLLRFEHDGSTEIVALDGAPEDIKVGQRAPATGDGAAQRVWRTGRAARIDDLAETSGHWPQVARKFGFSTGAAVPVLLQERLWGALVVVGRGEPLPPAIATHLTDFAGLASTAISAAQTRTQLRVLADEQAALRRVAELVARGAPLDEVFTATATEASKLLGDQAAALLRYDSDGHGTIVAAHNSPASQGLRLPSDGDTATGQVLRTGQPLRADSYEGTSLAEIASELGVRASVTVPILVEGRVWGTLSTSTAGPPPTAGTEDRLMQFAELAAAAIANAENKAKLTASRARVIATADETRRRLQRDLHDGAQQRLVHTLISLKLAKDAAAHDRPTVDLIEEALVHAQRANSELRDLVRGILPASLTRGGLAAGLETLVADLILPVDVRVSAPRLPPHAETTAYFIVAEALTNVLKHAHATRASIDVALNGDEVSILVRDDGTGGANPALGSGLTGLSDRVEASEGTLALTSPRGRGTTLHAILKLVGGD